MKNEGKEKTRGVAVVDLLRPAGTLVLVKYSAKITRWIVLGLCGAS